MKSVMTICILFLLLMITCACGSGFHSTSNNQSEEPTSYHATGYIIDLEGNPVQDVYVTILDYWNDLLYTGQTDVAGHFRIYIGSFYNTCISRGTPPSLQSLAFTVWSIRRPYQEERYVRTYHWFTMTHSTDIYVGTWTTIGDYCTMYTPIVMFSL